MSDTVQFIVDGVEVSAKPGQTIMQACDAAGIYIPRLCMMEGLTPHGSCRVCTCIVNGRAASACTQPVSAGMVVENETERVTAIRRDLIEMLFVEGNHFCMFCEKSGNCELQALAYRFGIAAPKYPYMFPQRVVDSSHPEVFIDHNRCVLCGRCVRASKELDGKNVFQFVGRGPHKRVAFNAAEGLVGTELAPTDKAIEACPTGSIVRKRTGYAVPIGQRLYDNQPIGSDIERRRTKSE